MAKRKSKRTAKNTAKRNRKESDRCKEPLEATGFYSLPDHLIEEILLWSRPKDEDQSIWRWVCRMSATCAAFRRVICSVKPGVAPLTPTVFELARESPFSLGRHMVELLNAIRQSDWMGTNIQSLIVDSDAFFGQNTHAAAIADALRSLLTSSGRLPNLTDLRLNCAPERAPILVGQSLFIRELVREHPGLTRLALNNWVLGYNMEDYQSPRTFATLGSLPNLQRFEITEVEWMESNHLVAFFSSIGSKMNHLSLNGKGGLMDTVFNGKVFESIATRCHNLETLRISGCVMTYRQFGNILRLNKNLSHLAVICLRHSDDRFIDLIVEHSPRLGVFDGSYCDWVNDDAIMKLINGQIDSFGRILLTKLCIVATRVTLNGLRLFLTRWREAHQGLPLKVHAVFTAGFGDEEERDEESMNRLAEDFPEVDWHFWLDEYYE